jgi:hypothetical protein
MLNWRWLFGSRTTRVHQVRLNRRLVCEPLEERRLLAASPALASARPADGHEDVYALIVSTSSTSGSLPTMVDFYHVLTDEHEVPANQITFLVVSDTIPVGYESIIDGIATKTAFLDALAGFGSRADADDLLLVNFEGHGTGYLGVVPENARNVAYHGFVYETPQVDQVGDGDQFDVRESDFELSLYCGGGTLVRDYHAGLDEWTYRWGADYSQVYRCMFTSHYSDAYVAGIGLLSDSDENIDLFTDYTLGDTNQDGQIDIAAGETADYDGDGIPCCNAETGVTDEDDWGPIDAFENATASFHSPLGDIPFHVFDRNLDNQTDVDLYPVEGGPYEVDGTDADNNGCINGIDINGDGDRDDWLAMDETIVMQDAAITDDELAAVFNPIDCGAKVFITNSCFGGGFINDLSGPKTIVMSGSLEISEALNGCFPRLLNEAFSTYSQEADADGNGKVSFAEAFSHAALHPHDYVTQGYDLYLLDDNGDGAGHRGPLSPSDEGTFAASVFLPPPESVIISGRVWNDHDANGQRDVVDEPYLSEWTVYLDTNRNGVLDAGEPQTLTDLDGSYRFSGLTPGEYVVSEILQPGWQHVLPDTGTYNVSAHSPQAVTGRTFTNQGSGSITGSVWVDWDGDGARDADDGGLRECQILICPAASGMSSEWWTFSDKDGSYSLDGLPPGEYTVHVVDRTGWQHTSPSGSSSDLTLGVDDTLTGVDFGEHPLYPVTGCVWEDLDGDGQRDPSEDGMSGFLVYIDIDHDGVFSGADWYTYTDADGSYLLAAHAAGSYTLRQHPNVGLDSSWPASGYYSVSLVLGEIVAGKDFAVRGHGSIAGVVWDDRDADGVRDSGEPGLAGWQLYIDADFSGTLTDGDWSAVTCDDGSYEFSGLGASCYRIAVVTPAGWAPPTSTWWTTVPVEIGQEVNGIDIGVRGRSAIRGTVWDDRDADGIRDSGEPGLAGWQLYIDADASGSLTDGDWSTVTASDGSYQFTGLGPGSYTVHLMVPPGWETTNPSGDAYSVTLAAAQSVSGQDFGNRRYDIDSAGLVDPATCTFYCRNSNTTGMANWTFACGDPTADWTALVGDWDGDGGDTIGFFDPAASVWYLRNSLSTGYADWTFGYGAPGAGWIPVVGDWDGNGTDTVGFFDPATCLWYLRNSLSTGFADLTFGYGDPAMHATPLVGDWDGDGPAGIGLYVPESGTFYLRNALTTGFADYTFGYGDPTAHWTPIVGNWDGTGGDTIGFYDPSRSLFQLRNSLSTGYADLTFGYGAPGLGWEPLVGRWTADPIHSTAQSETREQDQLAPSTVLTVNPCQTIEASLTDAIMKRWELNG